MKKAFLTLSVLIIGSIVGIVHGHLHLIEVRAQLQRTRNEIRAIETSDTLDFITDEGCSTYKYGKCL